MNAALKLNEFLEANNTAPSVDNEELLISAYQLIKMELIESNFSIETST